MGHMERLIYASFGIFAFILTQNVITENYLIWSTESGTFHMDEIDMLESWANETSDLQQI